MKFSALVLSLVVGSTAAFSHTSGRRTILSQGSPLSSTLEEVETKVDVVPYPVVTKTTPPEVAEPIAASAHTTLLEQQQLQQVSHSDVFVPTNTAPDTSRIHT